MRSIGHERFRFNGDHEAFADWMLSVVDSSPDKLGIFPMPVGSKSSDDEIDAVEEDVRRAYDIAKDQRPDLGVRLLVDRQGQLFVVVHEHKWIGGQCVNGCPVTRKVG